MTSVIREEYEHSPQLLAKVVNGGIVVRSHHLVGACDGPCLLIGGLPPFHPVAAIDEPVVFLTVFFPRCRRTSYGTTRSR